MGSGHALDLCLAQLPQVVPEGRTSLGFLPGRCTIFFFVLLVVFIFIYYTHIHIHLPDMLRDVCVRVFFARCVNGLDQTGRCFKN